MTQWAAVEVDSSTDRFGDRCITVWNLIAPFPSAESAQQYADEHPPFYGDWHVEEMKTAPLVQTVIPKKRRVRKSPSTSVEG